MLTNRTDYAVMNSPAAVGQQRAMLTGFANSVIFVGPKRVAKNSVQSACSVFDNRIGTVLPYRNKIMRFILEKV